MVKAMVFSNLVSSKHFLCMRNIPEAPDQYASICKKAMLYCASKLSERIEKVFIVAQFIGMLFCVETDENQ